MRSTKTISNHEILVSDAIAGCELPSIELTKFKYLTTDQKAGQSLGAEREKVDKTSERSCKSNTNSRGFDECQQFEIIWRDIAFEVQQSNSAIWQFVGKLLGTNGAEADGATSGERRLVLKHLNGHAKSGELMAILGPSGAGKTSLLNAICGRTENYRGSIQLVGGAKRRMRLSIIPQKDYLLDNLTVRESLMFASKTLDPDKSPAEHEANILRVVKMLNLIDCLDSNVSKISGGEYKRVSIAQELISQPDILVLDEPTSGLDSVNCKQLIRSLIGLVEASRQGKIKPLAVVMTIHQPDIDAFNMFDHVYCMARGGNVIYDGHPQDAMRTIRDYARFEQHNVPPELAQSSVYTNPANLLIEIASENIYGREPITNLAHLQQTQFKHSHSAASFKATSNYAADASSYSQQGPDMLSRDKRLSAKRRHRQGLFWYHLWILTQRTFKVTYHNSWLCYVSLVFYLGFPLLMFPIFSRNIGSTHACPVVVREFDILALARNETRAVTGDLQEQLRVGIESFTMLYLTVAAFSMFCIGSAALTFPLSMHVLFKELRNGWYDLSVYVSAKTLAGAPLDIGLPVASITVLYLLLEMPGSYLNWRLCSIALCYAFVALAGQTIGLIFGALLMDNVSAALTLSMASFLPQSFLSGGVCRLSRMPVVLQHLSWLMPNHYAVMLVAMFRYGFGLCPCSDELNDYLATSEPQFVMSGKKQLNQMLGYHFSNMLPAPTGDDVAEPSGITNPLILDSQERDQVLQQFSSQDFDLFKQLADQLARSFAFGDKIDSCRSSRSKVLSFLDAPDDKYALHLFCCLVVLLIALRLILIVVVRSKVNSRL